MRGFTLCNPSFQEFVSQILINLSEFDYLLRVLIVFIVLLIVIIDLIDLIDYKIINTFMLLHSALCTLTLTGPSSSGTRQC